jgi:hypothetical protein
MKSSAWQSQLRFYWLLKEDNLFLQQCNGKFQYGYEYMGLNGRLVITPLTDRIYLTITQVEREREMLDVYFINFILGSIDVSWLCTRFGDSIKIM